MTTWRRTVVLCAATAMVATAGTAWAQGGGPVAPRPAGGSRASAFGYGNTESKLVPIAPCRIVDTRKSGGIFTNGVTRSYHAVGAGPVIKAQGGADAGCSIPDAASAVQVTITAIGATGPGYLRAWPASKPEPTASFMGYGTGFNVAGSGLVQLCLHCGSAATDLTLKDFQSHTHIVIDVSGYTITPMGAVVYPNGFLAFSSRAASVNHFATGSYLVAFDRDVSGCAYSVSITINSTPRFAQANPATSEGTKVYVTTYDKTGADADAGFDLVVTC
ncbi:MAG: hypothetical protein JWM05_3641 [Acidimicrobiales bacterium]|nr:hypothetical protein [Acidimicrobiales bacterium]